jgi:hypothetical protein
LGAAFGAALGAGGGVGVCAKTPDVAMRATAAVVARKADA